MPGNLILQNSSTKNFSAEDLKEFEELNTTWKKKANGNDHELINYLQVNQDFDVLEIYIGLSSTSKH
ncbi:MAG: hypothetical protein WDO19_14875 [Bacteroidota bacterium]